MQFRKRISMLLLLLVALLFLSIAFVAVFLVKQFTLSSNYPNNIYMEQYYLDFLNCSYNYTDSGELSVFVICIMYVNVWYFHLPCF